MVAICIKYCYVLLINLHYIPDPPFLLYAILETALAHLRSRNALDDCHQIFMQYGNTARFSIYTESKQFFCHVL